MNPIPPMGCEYSEERMGQHLTTGYIRSRACWNRGFDWKRAFTIAQSTRLPITLRVASKRQSFFTERVCGFLGGLGQVCQRCHASFGIQQVPGEFPNWTGQHRRTNSSISPTEHL